MAAQRYLSEMTAAQAAASIETALDEVSKDLDQISVREWDSQPVRDMRNREQELHSALVVLRDMESNQGAFKLASTALEAPGAREVTVERYEIPGGMRSALEDVISYLRSHGRRDLVRLMQELYTAISPWDGGSCSDVPDALVPARPDAEYLLSIAQNHRWPMLMRAHIKAAARLATAPALEAPAAPAADLALIIAALEHGQPQMEHYAEPRERHAQALAAARRLAAAPQAPAAPVAYLDIGAGGYMDLGTDLSEQQLGALPKGRHMLAIIGTYGIDGYAAAPAAPVGDLAKLVKQLVQALRQAAPNHDLPAKALDYLRRQGLLGSPLRAATAADAKGA